MNADNLGAYYDFQQLANLRTQAVAAPRQAAGDVAAHFESLFVQMMLKSMRDATVEGGLFDSQQLDLYRGMFDQQIALQLSQQGALGLSRILVEQLDAAGALGEAPPREEDVAGNASGLLASARRAAVAPAMPFVPGRVAGAAPAPASPAAAPASPEAFIRHVWDDAVAAADALGVDPAVLVAQSALETGWGRQVIRADDGSSSHNLFGIKAGDNWRGPAATVRTVEYRDGVAALERASFRVYDSFADSFDDYVDLLTGSPRYRAALDSAGDSGAFLRGLQAAGYATDPAYAQKILGILGDAGHGSVFAELKNSSAQPLTRGEG